VAVYVSTDAGGASADPAAVAVFVSTDVGGARAKNAAAAEPVQEVRRCSEHGRQRTQCKECGGGSLIKYMRTRTAAEAV